MDLEKLKALFGRDITLCPRCKTVCVIGLHQCVDAESGFDYGEQIYLECPKCKEEGIFPWSSFLIVPRE